jgi:hypothetical protein
MWRSLWLWIVVGGGGSFAGGQQAAVGGGGDLTGSSPPPPPSNNVVLPNCWDALPSSSGPGPPRPKTRHGGPPPQRAGFPEFLIKASKIL